MPDRDKVIKGLECCTADLAEYHKDHFCDMCPYKSIDPQITYCFNKPELMRDALSLLKAQEPVKAYRLHGEKVIDNSEKVFTGQCTNCSCYLVAGWKACPACGKAVIWE